jgi:hypothetical protein
MLSAADLHEQAIALHSRRGLSAVTLRGPGQSAVTWDGANRATFRLAAFALESAVKAFLVYEHPEWIRGGRLSEDLCSHKLTKLASRSNLIPYPDRDQSILAAFEDGNENWMRYPCGRHADDIAPQRPMEERLPSTVFENARLNAKAELSHYSAGDSHLLADCPQWSR